MIIDNNIYLYNNKKWKLILFIKYNNKKWKINNIYLFYIIIKHEN